MSLFNVFLGYEDDEGKWIGDNVIFSKGVADSYYEGLLNNNFNVEEAINSVKRAIMSPLKANLRNLKEGDFELLGAYLIYDKNINGLALYHNDYKEGQTIKGNLQDFKPCFYITVDTVQKDGTSMLDDPQAMSEVKAMFNLFAEICVATEKDNISMEIKDINDSEINNFKVSVNTPIDKETLEQLLNEAFEPLRNLGLETNVTVEKL